MKINFNWLIVTIETIDQDCFRCVGFHRHGRITNGAVSVRIGREKTGFDLHDRLIVRRYLHNTIFQ